LPGTQGVILFWELAFILEGNTMNYKDQLSHPLWQKKRLEILERDEFKCRYCGDKETQLQVHHFFYKKGLNVWEYDNDNLITVCKHCHTVLTNDQKAKKDLILLTTKKVEYDNDETIVFCYYDNNEKYFAIIDRDGFLFRSFTLPENIITCLYKFDVIREVEIIEISAQQFGAALLYDEKLKR
jgi:hypothetical protein